MAANDVNLIVGEVEGTGAAINVSCGFKPSKVELCNIDDAGSVNATLNWINGMGAGTGIKSVTIADNGTTAGKANEFLSTLGITQYVGSSSAAEGFTIGADTDINVDGETIVYAAYR